jgi:hypothetical protein
MPTLGEDDLRSSTRFVSRVASLQCRAALICFSTATKVEARISYAHKTGMMFA